MIFASSLSASTYMPFALLCAPSASSRVPSASSCAAPATNCPSWRTGETFCYCSSMKKAAVTCGSVQAWLCPWLPTCDERSSFIARALCEWAASCRSLRGEKHRSDAGTVDAKRRRRTTTRLTCLWRLHPWFLRETRNRHSFLHSSPELRYPFAGGWSSVVCKSL